MTYHSEILKTYQTLLNRADDLLSVSNTMHDPCHLIETHNPIRGQQHEKDGLFNELRPLEKDVYRQAFDMLRHKTPFNPKISQETIKTPQIEWLVEQLNETVQNKDIRPIVFLGPKGSGKTTSLNFVIADVNRSFQDNKTLMIRGNAEEYCRIKKEFYPEINPLWNIREYMKHHTANLFALHRDKEPFKTIVSEISDRLLSPSIPEDSLATPIRRSIRKGERVRVSNLIEAIAEQCNILKSSGFPYGETMITYELKKRISQIEKNGQVSQFHTSWPALWASLDDYFQEANIKVFFVFDGLDNVWSFGEEEKRAYRSTIEDLANELRDYFGRNEHKTNTRFYYIVACRAESFQQLNENINRITNDECLFRYESEKDTAHTDKIIIKKFGGLKGKILALQKHGLEEIKGGKFYEALTKIGFADHLNMLASEAEVSPPDLFGNNTRGIIANFLSFAIFVSFYSQEVRNGKMPPNATEFHIFLRNLFFGGRRFVRTVKWTHDYQWKHSVIFPNIFHVDLSPVYEKVGEISGLLNPLLCGVRLLDELAQKPFTEKELLKVLRDEYAYDELIINNVVHLFLQFRLIEPEEPALGRVFCHNRLRALPSTKVLRYILNHHIDILAYLAFDSILPGNVYSWIFGKVDLSKHNYEYLSNTIGFGLKFIAFLNALSSKEGGSRSLFPIDGHLKRTEYLLTELESTIGRPKVLEFLETLTIHV